MWWWSLLRIVSVQTMFILMIHVVYHNTKTLLTLVILQWRPLVVVVCIDSVKLTNSLKNFLEKHSIVAS